MTKKEKCENYPKDCKSYGKINSDSLCRRCANNQARTILLEAVKQDVQKTHTETGIRPWIQAWHVAGASFAIIAKALPDGVTSQDIRRAEMGIMPVHNRKRELLGLPPMKRVPANLEVFDPATHALIALADAPAINGSAPTQGKPSKPRNYDRISIRKDDAAKARNTITANTDPVFVRALADGLNEYLETTLLKEVTR